MWENDPGCQQAGDKPGRHADGPPPPVALGVKNPQLGFCVIKNWSTSFLPCDERSAKRGIAIVSHPSVCPSLCNVDIP